MNKFRMPGEFERHQGTILIWPVRPGSWTYGGKNAQKVFCEIANIISKTETLYMAADKEHISEVREIFKDNKNVVPLEIATNDSWARDIGPTCVLDEDNKVIGIDWKFNAWGGDFDGLYKDYDLDDKFAKIFCEKIGIKSLDLHPFVLEGGSIHVDGEGTLITTETCLLSQGRNPELTKDQIEDKLKEALNIEKVIWLKGGILGDETNEHVDNIMAFVKPGEVVMSWTDDKDDPQYLINVQNEEIINNTTDAKGRKLILHKLPLPQNPVTITQDELDHLYFEDGEDMREVGEKLAASYANFYIINDALLVPQFEDPNDIVAVNILKDLFPDRTIYPIYARDIIVGGGNIHCITQQIPLGG